MYYSDEKEYYDVLGLTGENKLEAIPAPVFVQIAGLPKENYFEEIRSLLGDWFGIVCRTREEWQNMSESDLIRE